MEPDKSENEATAKDGMPSPQPQQAKGSAKKPKKPKAKPEQVTPPADKAAAAEGGSTAQTPKSKQKGDKPASAKKQKAEKKVEGQAQGQAEVQGQAKIQGQGQGEGQVEGEAAAAPKKSNAELKAERRAIQEAQRAAKAAQKAGGQPGQGPAKQEAPRVPAKVLRDDPNMEKKEGKKLAKQNVPQRSSATRRVALFNHLKQYDPDLKHLNELQVWHNLEPGATHGIHPAISTLGLQYADYTIIGSNARAVGLLAAFQEVIWDYKTPADKDMCRALETHITRLISFLDQCRPLSISMGNAIKFLKQKIINLSENHNGLSEEEAKQDLILSMKKFVKEKISKAGQAISIYTRPIIKRSEVIIVYGYSSVIYNALRKADNKESLTVLVVDSRPRHEGQKMLKALTRLGIKCIFVPLEQAAFYIRNIHQPSTCKLQKTRLFLGAHGVLNNAYVMSRIGTASLASIAKALNIPVYACFETYKITDRSQTDSFVFNELGDANELEAIGHLPPILTNWKEQRTLGLLNLMYDVTPNSHFSTFITEIGLIPDTSIPKVSPLNVDSRPTAADEPEVGPDCLLLRRQFGLQRAQSA
ncbi:translation initiation factor eIF2B subunit delta-like [Littorina saxatilis]|uniref:Translation initiation factor eIF2B subunit delta n=1 Tax=Littorina saxatilis TaxID=31220 RepID=A0AAN9G257_9CAEN